MLKDKDRAAVVHELSALKPVWHLVSLTGPRASTANELREFVKEEATGYDSVKEALEQIQAQLTPEDLVVVCGSFLTVTEALQWQTQQAN
jgi:dihydrofolate synthase/folylpolyglutamate synthase